MKEVGIFFGSDTGNTRNVANLIQRKLKFLIPKIFDISVINGNEIERYKRLFFGISTWYYGEAQYDWDDFFPTLKKMDFSGKMVALFGCGDQEDYSEYFCDALRELYDILKFRGANLVGEWPNEGYHFESSKALLENGKFVGLVIDEDRQPELTKNRIEVWIKKVIKEMKLI